MALCLLPLFIIPTRRVGRRRKAIKRLTQRALAELTGILTETLSVSGALLLKVFGGEAREAERVADKGRQLRDLSIRQTLLGRWFQMALGLFESAGPALVFAVGGWLIMHDHLKLGTVVAFVTILKRLYGSLSQLAGVHVDVVTSYAYFERVFDLLDVVPEIVDRTGGAALAERPAGRSSSAASPSPIGAPLASKRSSWSWPQGRRWVSSAPRAPGRARWRRWSRGCTIRAPARS